MYYEFFRVDLVFVVFACHTLEVYKLYNLSIVEQSYMEDCLTDIAEVPRLSAVLISFDSASLGC